MLFDSSNVIDSRPETVHEGCAVFVAVQAGMDEWKAYGFEGAQDSMEFDKNLHSCIGCSSCHLDKISRAWATAGKHSSIIR